MDKSGEIRDAKSLIMLQTIINVMRLDKEGKASWVQSTPGKEGHASELQDFREIFNALKEDEFRGYFLINQSNDGTVLVGWNLNYNTGNNEKANWWEYDG